MWLCVCSLIVSSLNNFWFFATPWTAAHQASLSITNFQFTQTHVHWVCDAIQPSHLLLSPSPLAFNLSQHQGLFKWVRWPKYRGFSFSISPSNEYSGLISFRIGLFDLLAVQGTVRSLLQHHSSKASILQLSAFFIVQLSHPYMTTEKTIALTRWIFVGKVMSLLLNMLSRLVITFLPRSQLFASGVQSTGVSASVSILPVNIQDWFPLGRTGLSPCSPRGSQESSPTP